MLAKGTPADKYALMKVLSEPMNGSSFMRTIVANKYTEKFVAHFLNEWN